MLYYNKNTVSRFDETFHYSVNTNDILLISSDGYVKKRIYEKIHDIWISLSVMMGTNDRNYLTVRIPVCFENGTISNFNFYTDGDIKFPTGVGTNTSPGKYTSNVIKGAIWHRLRLHVWAEDSDLATFHVSAYSDEGIMIENLTYTASAKISYFQSVDILARLSNFNIRDFIFSDKFFSESAKIKEIPITQIKNWTKNADTGEYYASKVNQKGTLVADPLLLADLEKYDIVTTAISGKLTREGDNFKNLEITVGDKVITQELPYGTNPTDIDVGNDLSALSNVTITPKG